VKSSGVFALDGAIKKASISWLFYYLQHVAQRAVLLNA
jgi:hypothetical protein